MKKICILTFLFFNTACYVNNYSSSETLDSNHRLVPSGFLSNYSRLSPSQKKQGAYTYINREKKLEHFKMIMFEGVEIKLHKNSKGNEASARKLQELAWSFTNEIREELGSSYIQVQQPGFGVMKVRIAVTDVVADFSIFRFNPSYADAGIELDVAAIEAEFIDANTNDQIAAFVDYSGDEIYSAIGLRNNNKPKNRAEAWARLLRDRLDESRGLNPNSTYGLTDKKSF